MRNTKTLISAAVALGLLSVPSTLAQGTQGEVTGIVLQAVPNAVAISWQAPGSITIDHYTVYYSKQSMLENNGRFDEKESTLGDETSLVLLDLRNRSFHDGDTMFVTVTATDVSGQEHRVFTEEQSTQVNVPGSLAPHAAAPTTDAGSFPTVKLEHVVSQSLTSILLQFSKPVRISSGNPAAAFRVTDASTQAPIAVIQADVQGRDIMLLTAPMVTRNRYDVAASDAVTAEDGAPLDPLQRVASFVARGEEVESPPQVEPPPPPLLAVPVPQEDTTPPEPPRDLRLRKTLQRDGLYTVDASWEESLNIAQDLQSYNIYESADRGKTFAGPTAVRATVTSTTIANVPPGTLTVKVTAMDHTGNESEGIQETIILPETGPALTLLLSVAGAGIWTARRKIRSTKFEARNKHK